MTMGPVGIAALTGLIALGACSATGPVEVEVADVPVVIAPVSGPISEPFDRVEFDQIIDGIRVDNGERTLAINDQLNDASQDYAELMVETGTLSHVGPDGSTANERAAAAGYDADFLAENIAKGPGTNEGVMSAWMGSPGHRDNILDPRAEDFGLGREDDTWVLMLGSQR